MTCSNLKLLSFARVAGNMSDTHWSVDNGFFIQQNVADIDVSKFHSSNKENVDFGSSTEALVGRRSCCTFIV